MIVVVSDTRIFAGEHDDVNQLFDEGLQLFHLRKYENTESEIADLLQQIKPHYWQRIALHQFHHMASAFGIQRLHFPETECKKWSVNDLNTLRAKGYCLSASVHSVEEYNNLPDCFEYTFLSPVFDSISKKDYKAGSFEWDQLKGSATRLIALGGIHPGNCAAALEMGFDGVALKGSLWQSENKLNVYKEAEAKCSTSVR